MLKTSIAQSKSPFSGLKEVIRELFDVNVQIPSPGSTSSVWFVAEIIPELSKKILSHNYRKNRKRDRGRIRRYVNELRGGGRWYPTSAIAFCWVSGPNGGLFLVDGQHRCWAVEDSQLPMEVGVCVYACVSMKEVREVYSKFNTAKECRTDGDLIANYADLFGIGDRSLTDHQIAKLLPAREFLVSRLSKASFAQNRPNADTRFRQTAQFSAPAMEYYERLEGCIDGDLAKALERSQEVAWFVTLINTPSVAEQAKSLLSSVLSGEDLPVGSGAYWTRYLVMNTVSAHSNNGTDLSDNQFAYGRRDFGHLRRLAKAWELHVSGETAVGIETFSSTRLTHAVEVLGTDIVVGG